MYGNYEIRLLPPSVQFCSRNDDNSNTRLVASICQRVACLLRKVVQEIERRISTQAEHLRMVCMLLGFDPISRNLTGLYDNYYFLA